MIRNNTTTAFPFSSKPAHNGIPHQYFHYSPWGESLISQTRTPNPTSFTTPYRFNAKELDLDPSEASSRIPMKLDVIFSKAGCIATEPGINFQQLMSFLKCNH